MRIAICDDEPRELELLHSFLLRYDTTLPYTLFSSAQDLLDASSSTFFDIIFMDIEMRSPNGYDAAVSLMQNEARPLIIFVTKSSSYTILGYGVAFRYLKKPISYDAFSAVLKLTLEEVVPQNQFHCSHLDDDTHQEAQQHHMSAGKYRVIDEILRHDSAKSVEELQKLSMKELYSVLERYDPSAVPEGCHGRQMRKGHHHGS